MQVNATGAARTEILRVLRHMNATVVELQERTFVLRVCDTSEAIDRVVSAVRMHCHTTEIVRSGTIFVGGSRD